MYLYDYITIPIFLLGLGYSIYAGTWTNTVPIALIVFVVLFVMALKGGIAGGDVKFATALAVWFGYPLIIYVLGLGAFLGFLWGLALMIKNGTLKNRMVPFIRGMYMKFAYRVNAMPVMELPDETEEPGDAVPYGTFMVIAAWVIFALHEYMGVGLF